MPINIIIIILINCLTELVPPIGIIITLKRPSGIMKVIKF